MVLALEHQAGLQPINAARLKRWPVRSLKNQADIALIVLGDQPQIQKEIVEKVVHAGLENPEKMIIPSFQQRRGHPWTLPAIYWDEISQLKPPQAIRDVINGNREMIQYLDVTTSSILQDLDTPEDYERERPR